MLQHRSEEKELLDLGPNYYTAQEYQHCLKLLFSVNRLFRFFSTTVKLLKKFSPHATLLDVGCGSGLFLIHLSKHFPHMQLHGVDISMEAINFAHNELERIKKFQPIKSISFQLQPSITFEAPSYPVDIILATLVCHHLNDDDLVFFIQNLYLCARSAVIINDLHRHAMAQLLYRILSPLLFRNRLISHDGLISIRRSFTRAEWQILLKKAGITHYQLKWGFPFRWQLILWK